MLDFGLRLRRSLGFRYPSLGFWSVSCFRFHVTWLWLVVASVPGLSVNRSLALACCCVGLWAFSQPSLGFGLRLRWSPGLSVDLWLGAVSRFRTLLGFGLRLHPSLGFRSDFGLGLCRGFRHHSTFGLQLCRSLWLVDASVVPRLSAFGLPWLCRRCGSIAASLPVSAFGLWLRQWLGSTFPSLRSSRVPQLLACIPPLFPSGVFFL